MADRTLRVLTLNIGSLLEPWWDRRRLEIVAGLRRHRPDVVCFQEVSASSSRGNRAGEVAELLAEAGDDGWHWAFGGSAPSRPR